MTQTRTTIVHQHHKTEEAVCQVLTRERPKLVFSHVQDVSGSMAGSRIDASLTGVDYMHANVFQPDDFLGVVTFNSDVRTVHQPMPVRRVNRAHNEQAILAW